MTMKHGKILTFLTSLLIFWMLVPFAYAQENELDIQLTTEKISENLYMLTDSGGMGNSVVLTGDDGLLLIDTKSAGGVDKLLAQISKLSNKPIRFVINTHWHFDHVSGNEKVALSGATIIAHENVRKQMGMPHDMKALNSKVSPAPQAARPALTFKDELGLHMDGEDVRVFHLASGHTDGDAVIYFPKANVIHMGDLYFEGLYPYIGIYSGGSINGMIKVIEQILPMMDTNTKVVPGHGPLSTKTGLQVYLDMLTAVRDKVGLLIKEGKTIEQAVASKPTQTFDEKWGKGFLTPDQFTRIVYMDLSPDLP